jgi:RNA polymerase sigma factor (sigma-70 family)
MTIHLTDEQRKLINDNYGLLMSFYHRDMDNRLLPSDDEDALFSELQWRFCYAARKYDPSSGFKFSTFCYHGLRMGVSNFWKKAKRDSRVSFIDTSLKKYTYIPDKIKSVDIDSLEKIINGIEEIPDRDKRIFITYFLESKTMKTVCLMFNLSRARISQIINSTSSAIGRYMKTRGFKYSDFIIEGYNTYGSPV